MTDEARRCADFHCGGAGAVSSGPGMLGGFRCSGPQGAGLSITYFENISDVHYREVGVAVQGFCGGRGAHLSLVQLGP